MDEDPVRVAKGMVAVDGPRVVKLVVFAAAHPLLNIGCVVTPVTATTARTEQS
jgi:hypothetical protein